MHWADYMQEYAVVNIQIFGDFMLRALNTHKSDADLVREKSRACVCCQNQEHHVTECAEFKAYSADNRWKFAQTNRLCQSCLNGHERRSCMNAKPCLFEGYQYKNHPPLPKQVRVMIRGAVEMCHQLSIRKPDRYAQRFLFRSALSNAMYNTPRTGTQTELN